MIKVRELKTVFNHCFGVQYAVRISQVAAMKICGAKGIRLPRMGYETKIAKKRMNPDWEVNLYLENCSGDFFLTCAQMPRDKWAELFDCHVQERKHD
jgi:hypothetical protein